jgi:alpha-amylase
MNKKATLWRFPIETISMSEAGFERVYQGSVILPNWKIRLGNSKTWQVTIEQYIERI